MLLAFIIILLIVLIMLRVPVSFVIFGTGVLGLLFLGGFDLVLPVMETAPATAVRSTALTAIPLFMLMAQFMLMSGLLDSLFDAARGLVGRVPGGTAVASVGAGTAFAGCYTDEPDNDPYRNENLIANGGYRWDNGAELRGSWLRCWSGRPRPRRSS